MSHSKASWLAWTLCALVVGLSAVGLALTFAGPNAPRLAPALVQTALESVIPVVFAVVAALIVAHQPRNTIGWLLMVIALGVYVGLIVLLQQLVVPLVGSVVDETMQPEFVGLWLRDAESDLERTNAGRQPR